MAGASRIRVAGNRILENFQFSGNFKVYIIPTKQNSEVLESSTLFYARKPTSTSGWGVNTTLPTVFPVKKLVEAANQTLASRSSQQKDFWLVT